MAAAASYTLFLALTPLSSSASSSNSKRPISSSLFFLLPQTAKTSFLSIQPIISPPSKQTPRRHSTSILFMLPTANPDRAPADKIPGWSVKSIKSFGMAELEARKLKHPTTGTEALLMGILVEGTNEAAKFLHANGITLFQVREETVKLLGKSDMYFFSPEHPPLTEPAQRALDWAIDEKMKSGEGGEVTTSEGGEVTTSHMLLGIWSEKDSAGHKILATLGFDDKKASELTIRKPVN